MNQPKTLTINVSDSITPLEAIKLRQFEDGFMLGETISRDKIAGKTRQRHTRSSRSTAATRTSP